MHVALLMRVALLSGIVLTPLACGGGARGRAWPPAGPPPEVVKPMVVPPSPYYLIYSPPLNLAKPPDTTAPARKPGSERRDGGRHRNPKPEKALRGSPRRRRAGPGGSRRRVHRPARL